MLNHSTFMDQMWIWKDELLKLSFGINAIYIKITVGFLWQILNAYGIARDQESPKQLWKRKAKLKFLISKLRVSFDMRARIQINGIKFRVWKKVHMSTVMWLSQVCTVPWGRRFSAFNTGTVLLPYGIKKIKTGALYHITYKNSVEMNQRPIKA